MNKWNVHKLDGQVLHTATSYGDAVIWANRNCNAKATVRIRSHADNARRSLHDFGAPPLTPAKIRGMARAWMSRKHKPQFPDCTPVGNVTRNDDGQWSSIESTILYVQRYCQRNNLKL